MLWLNIEFIVIGIFLDGYEDGWITKQHFGNSRSWWLLKKKYVIRKTIDLSEDFNLSMNVIFDDKLAFPKDGLPATYVTDNCV